MFQDSKCVCLLGTDARTLHVCHTFCHTDMALLLSNIKLPPFALISCFLSNNWCHLLNTLSSILLGIVSAIKRYKSVRLIFLILLLDITSCFLRFVSRPQTRHLGVFLVLTRCYFVSCCKSTFKFAYLKSFWVSIGGIVACDSSSALLKGTDKFFNVQCNHKHADLLSSCTKILNSNNIHVSPKHVLGHQDDSMNYQSLPRLSQMNVRMDYFAKQSRTLFSDQIQEHRVYIPLGSSFSNP